ncbi:YrdB family protein [Rhizobium calliandrae]|uniref:YrdB family protein n=1 Tax=Rhizobium calliandrae TaxID=1312182 RepID=A0ABT7KRG2_9HYPH|nr:YrdB family protein [Rhizobium calliandrae]MDL2410777.1 YrdB family protein [Rhizobium calliandrae]
MSERIQRRGGQTVRATVLGIRFSLKLCILASLAIFAAHLDVTGLVQVLLGLVFCVMSAAVWGAFLSPKRKHEIGLAGRLALEAAFFAGAALILAYVGWPVSALALIAVAVADRIALALIS